MSILKKILSVFQKQQNNQQSEPQNSQQSEQLSENQTVQQNETHNNPQKIHYVVRGRDTFACEYFDCGSFDTRSEAEKLVEQLEESVKSQVASLRDEFWVVEMTDEMIAERRSNEVRIWKEKQDELSFNSSHLIECVRRLLQLFKSFWETADIEALRGNDDENLKLEVDWQDEEDCFEQIHFDTMFIEEDQRLHVGIGVNIRKGKYFNGSIIRTCQFSGTLAEMLEWADTEKALDDCVKEIGKLIFDFDD